LTITKTGQSVILTWPHVSPAITHYQVYRSTTPYFAAGDPGVLTLDDNVQPPGSDTTISFTDPDAFPDLPAMNFYLVQSVDEVNQAYPAATNVGIFGFALEPGTP
jgi:hypothetical protein